MRFSRVVVVASLCLSAAACQGLDPGGGGDSDRVGFSRGYAFVRDGDVFVADASDYEAPRRLTRSGSNRSPSLSADGRTVVFVHSGPNGESSIRRVSTGGSDETDLVPASVRRQVGQPALSPDGRQVAFFSRHESLLATVSVVNLDGSGERELVQSRYDFSPSFYPWGGALLVLTGPNTLDCQELVRADLTGPRDSRVSGLTGVEKRAVLSPDARLIALEMRTDVGTRIFVVDESGSLSSLRAVADTRGNESSPTWVSPTRLGFASDAGGLSNIYEVDVRGSPDSYVPVVADATQCSYGGR